MFRTGMLRDGWGWKNVFRGEDIFPENRQNIGGRITVEGGEHKVITSCRCKNLKEMSENVAAGETMERQYKVVV